MSDEENFFSKYNLEVGNTDLEDCDEGGSYPLYGMITDFIDDTPGSVSVEVNWNFVLKMNLDDVKKIETLKERAFEPGIFISTLQSKGVAGEMPVFTCQTVVFGRKQSQEA